MTGTPGKEPQPDGDLHVPVTYDRCAHVSGPFLDGTRAALEIGTELVPGRATNVEEGRVSRHVYVVAPPGPFEDDPNVTDKRFPGNPTRSFRIRDPLRVVGEPDSWEGHPPEVVQGMLDSLARLWEQGLAVIED